jgi:hypothetical protein
MEQTDALIGRAVMIRSALGIDYSGIVRSIRAGYNGSEVFELGRLGDDTYQRFVLVTQRDQQIHLNEG